MFDNPRLLTAAAHIYMTVIRSFYVRRAYMWLHFLTTSIFYYNNVEDRAFFLLYALSGPLRFCLFSVSSDALIYLCLRNFNISSAFLLFVAPPYCPVFSLSLLVFSILELKSPAGTTPLCLLYVCTSTATLFPNFLCIS